MKQKLLLISAFLLIVWCSAGQVADRLGVSLGTSYASQKWQYRNISNDMEHEYKVGLQAFVFAEKDLAEMMSLLTGLGYIQKGFKDEFVFTFPDASVADVRNDKVVLHNLALDLGVKIRPFSSTHLPYLLLGGRADYLLSYKDAVIVEPESGIKINVYEPALEKFNKFNVSALVGLGIEFNDFLFFELEYNPGLTRNFKSEGLTVRDQCWGAKLGVYLNRWVD
ncbi:PorT family protein [Maribellus sp. CM-23]|uniref:porin family protein n=1 Tax=Maribellus sp. CM-23 TaxID=2781026 RepID=UPI001F347512|nr:porin family protein [Maribellus sp. CM-23]MCE4564472.1 PorT family protein [Maribellus sp. CM-23]